MLTKKFTDFSADLLDTVRGVLGEAKKCKECGCAKCECEDEGKEDDDMEEGYVPTSDEPTEANKKTADKVRALLAKEKKPVKEEIDDALEAELKAQRQTKKSVADAKKKYGVKEEAEQIDELSDALLKNYSKKALAQSKTATGDQKLKRQVGARNAIDRLGNNTLAKEEVELEEGITSMSDARLKFHATKDFPHGSYTKKQIKDEHERRRRTVANYHTVKASLGEEAEQIDELSTKTLDSYRSKARKDIIDADANDDTDTYNKRTKGYTKASKKIQKNFVKGVDESFQQIDELSKKTLGSYAKKAINQSFGKGVAGGAALASTNKETEDQGHKLVNKAAKRMQGAQKAISKLTKEEQDFIDSLNAMDLDEARGRPKKAGGKDFTIHPKTKEKLMHNNPEHMKKIELLQKNKVLDKPKTEAGQHIMNQLRKAQTSMTGGSTIHFTHGDSKHVSGTHAAKLLDKYAGMKPNEKEDFQKKIGHSHEQLMKHV